MNHPPTMSWAIFLSARSNTRHEVALSASTAADHDARTVPSFQMGISLAGVRELGIAPSGTLGSCISESGITLWE
jgi:hypothetical protein